VEDGEILIKKIEIGEIWGKTVIFSFVHGPSVSFKVFSKKLGFHLLEELIFLEGVVKQFGRRNAERGMMKREAEGFFDMLKK